MSDPLQHPSTLSLGAWLVRPTGWTPLQALSIALLGFLALSILLRCTPAPTILADVSALVATLLLEGLLLAAAWRRYRSHNA